MPDPSEIAVLKVGGHTFDDWESVHVQHRWTEAWPIFRFTCAEREDRPDVWSRLQFKPGDPVEIWLAGVLAMVGKITVRQVAYDAKGHHVELIGQGKTWEAATSSVNTKDGSFDGMTHEQIARKVLAPHSCGLKVIGKLDATPFEKCQNEKGELVFDFLERLARVRGHIMGSDHLGNFLLIGEHSSPIVQDLVEGQNILRCQAVFNIGEQYGLYRTDGQTSGSDEQNNSAANDQSATAPGNPLVPASKILITAAEQPVKQRSELEMRAYYESLWRKGVEIDVNITVQGWLRDGKNLWRVSDNVFVNSPMIMIHETMKIERATFTQDRRTGTLTALKLKMPWALQDGNLYSTGGTQFPAPGPATTNTEPPVDPPRDPSKPPGGDDEIRDPSKDEGGEGSV